MCRNDNHKYSNEQHGVGMEELQEWIDAAREDTPDTAQWQTARRNLAMKLKTYNKENFIMRLLKNLTGRQYRWAAAAACAVLVFIFVAGIGFLDSGPGLAFAEVLERIYSIHTLSYKSTVETPGQPTFIMKALYKAPGIQRMTQDNGNVIIMDMVKGKSMTLVPSQKKGSVIDFSNLPQNQRQQDFIASLQQLKEGAEMIVGEKEIDGHTTLEFHTKQDGMEYTIWADTQTGLPVRIEIKMAMFGDMKVTLTDFVFNPDLDESLFLTELPEGYEEIKMPAMPTAEPSENDLIEMLRMCAEASQGKFPESLTMQDVAKLLGGKIGDGNPTEEQIQEFTAQYVKLTQGLLFYQLNSENNWNYDVEGIKLGDQAPICWWKPKDSETYRVIYADLTTADVHPDEFEVKE